MGGAADPNILAAAGAGNSGGGGGMLGGAGGFFEDRTGFNMGSHSSADKALRAQQAAAAQSERFQREMYEQQRADAAPWRQAGVDALGRIKSGMDTDYMKDFGMGDFQADPGYQFRLQEAEKAINRSASARGMGNSGATLSALVGKSQNMASAEYQNAYNRFNSDRDRRFNRLSNLAGLGQTANTQVMGAAQNYGSSMSDIAMGMGNAGAAKHINQANRMNQWMDQQEDKAMQFGGMAFSDARLKKDVEPIPPHELEEFRVNIRPILFKYINDAHGTGQWAGVFAQDLEKSRLGRTLIVTDAQGNKQIDLKKAVSLMLATMAEA